MSNWIRSVVLYFEGRGKQTGRRALGTLVGLVGRLELNGARAWAVCSGKSRYRVRLGDGGRRQAAADAGLGSAETTRVVVAQSAVVSQLTSRKEG